MVFSMNVDVTTEVEKDIPSMVSGCWWFPKQGYLKSSKSMIWRNSTHDYSIYIYGSQNCSWVLQIIQNIEIQDFWSTHFRKPPYILYHVFASGCKTARVVVHIFLMVVSLSGVSGGGVGVGGWGGCDNVNVDTTLILAFGIFCAVVSRGFRVGGLGCGGGGGVITSMWTPSWFLHSEYSRTISYNIYIRLSFYYAFNYFIQHLRLSFCYALNYFIQHLRLSCCYALNYFIQHLRLSFCYALNYFIQHLRLSCCYALKEFHTASKTFVLLRFELFHTASKTFLLLRFELFHTTSKTFCLLRFELLHTASKTFLLLRFELFHTASKTFFLLRFELFHTTSKIFLLLRFERISYSI